MATKTKAKGKMKFDKEDLKDMKKGTYSKKEEAAEKKKAKKKVNKSAMRAGSVKASIKAKKK